MCTSIGTVTQVHIDFEKTQVVMNMEQNTKSAARKTQMDR